MSYSAVLGLTKSNFGNMRTAAWLMRLRINTLIKKFVHHIANLNCSGETGSLTRERWCLDLGMPAVNPPWVDVWDGTVVVKSNITSAAASTARNCAALN